MCSRSIASSIQMAFCLQGCPKILPNWSLQDELQIDPFFHAWGSRGVSGAGKTAVGSGGRKGEKVLLLRSCCGLGQDKAGGLVLRVQPHWSDHLQPQVEGNVCVLGSCLQLEGSPSTRSVQGQTVLSLLLSRTRYSCARQG